MNETKLGKRVISVWFDNDTGKMRAHVVMGSFATWHDLGCVLGQVVGSTLECVEVATNREWIEADIMQGFVEQLTTQHNPQRYEVPPEDRQ